MLSKKALQLIEVLFSEKSQLNLPIGVAEQVIEIRNWSVEELKNSDNQEKKDAGK